MLNFNLRGDNKLIVNKKIFYIFLFIFIFSFFLWLNSNASFVDPDSFYHAKIAEFIGQNGPVKNFYWLPFTSLDEVYIDHHFLYHLILIPLVSVLSPLVAVKLAAVFFAALAILVFQWLLDKLKIKYSYIYTLILVLTHQFIFRLNLAKTTALSLIVLLFFIYLLFNFGKKWSWKIFFLAFAYVWLYAGWPIMLGIGFLYWLVSIVQQWVKTKKINLKLIVTDYWLLLVNFSSGIIAGLIINPYFPTNLKFYWQQIFKIGLVNYKQIIAVGGEWYGLGFFSLIQYSLVAVVVLVLAIVLFFVKFKKQKPGSYTLFLTSLIFFVLTLKSQRNIEYFVPFSLIFSAFVFNLFIKYYRISDLKKKYSALGPIHKKFFVVMFIMLAVYLPFIFWASTEGLKEGLGRNYRFDEFKNISHWLVNNSRPLDIVFHDKWDDWPVLFYYNSYNRYIVGLDPSFMYFKDKQRYWLWRNISDGRIAQNICQTVKVNFLSNYILVKRDNFKLKNILDKDEKCQLAYKDRDGWIFEIN